MCSCVSTLLPKCTKTRLKCLLIVFNILVTGVGMGLVAVGTLAYLQLFPYETTLFASNFSLVEIIVIVIGHHVILLPICGCCAAGCERTWSLRMYAVFLLILASTQVMVGGMILMQPTTLQDYVHKNIDAFFISEYKDQIDAEEYTVGSFDHIQIQFQCCGVNGSSDYTRANLTLDASLPPSCCTKVASQPAPSCDVASAHEKGCMDEFTAYLSCSVTLIGIVLICTVVIEFLAAISASNLAIRIIKESVLAVGPA